MLAKLVTRSILAGLTAIAIASLPAAYAAASVTASATASPACTYYGWQYSPRTCRLEWTKITSSSPWNCPSR